MKATEIILTPCCIIGNPMVSDGMQCTIMGYKDGESFLVNEWGGLTGKATAIGHLNHKRITRHSMIAYGWTVKAPLCLPIS